MCSGVGMPCLLGFFRRLSSISSARWTASELGLDIWVCKRPNGQEQCAVWVSQASTRQRQQAPCCTAGCRCLQAGGGGSVPPSLQLPLNRPHTFSPHLTNRLQACLAREQGRRPSRSLPRALQPAPEPASPAAVQQSNLAGPGKARARRSSTSWDCCRPPPPTAGVTAHQRQLFSPMPCPPIPQAFLVAQRL